MRASKSKEKLPHYLNQNVFSPVLYCTKVLVPYREALSSMKARRTVTYSSLLHNLGVLVIEYARQKKAPTYRIERTEPYFCMYKVFSNLTRAKSSQLGLCHAS